MTDILARQRQLIGTTAEWAADDIVLGNGEVAVERVSASVLKLKIGDGTKKFSALPYVTGGTAGAIAGGLSFKGVLDVAVAAPAAVAGDYYAANADAAVHASFTGVTGNVSKGDLFLYDGTSWHVIAQESDLTKYLPLTGGTLTGMVHGDEFIEYKPFGALAKPTTVQAKLRESVSVKDFGAVGDGIANDKAAITSAFAASKSVRFPSGTYNVGSVSASENIFGSIDGGGGLVSIETDGSVKFICNTTDNTIPTFFNISNAVRVTVGNVAFEDSGYDNSVTWKGAAGIRLVVSAGIPINDVNIGSIYAKKMVNPFVVTGTSTTRATGIRIGAMYLDDCYYGPNLQNNGDDCVIGAIYATGVLRSAFVYGVTGFKAKIYSNGNLQASADCLISAYDTGYDTKDVSIQYTGRSPANAATLIGMHILGEGSRTISNVNIDLDVTSTTGADLVSMRAYNTAGTVENTGATTNLWTGIKVRFVGSTAGANLLAIYCKPNTKGSINICEGIPFNKMRGITELFTFANYPTGTFTPTVFGTGTAGVGTYSTQSGRFTIIGNRVFYDINLVWSAHTGAGPYMKVSGLPIKCNASANNPASAIVFSDLVVGAGKQLGAVVIINDTIIQLYAQDVAGGAIELLAFDTAGTLYLSGNYEIG